jgi:poly(hydroxyalkanoate) depolymerase family esterase
MNLNFKSLMNEAARLTRAGDLHGAAAAIRSALGAGPAANEPAGGAAALPGIEPPPGQPRPAAPRNKGETQPPSPQGDTFVSGNYANASGSRDYKLYLPPGAGAAALPLVVMLHGCTQNPDDFAAGTAMNELARTQAFYVLYPAQSRKANPQGCWNWFKHSHQQRGRGEPALLADMAREVMARHPVDPRRVYVAGLSAGGAMAAIMGASYPDVFAAVGVHSGLAAGAASDLQTALAAMKGGAGNPGSGAQGVPTIVFHGDADSTVHPANGDEVAAASAGAGCVVEIQRVPAGATRAFTKRIYTDGADGRVTAEHWLVHGSAHAWSGGSARGTYTDGQGPDASAQMLRFFLEHPRPRP